LCAYYGDGGEKEHSQKSADHYTRGKSCEKEGKLQKEKEEKEEQKGDNRGRNC
jgi:hypothetical protein